MKIIKLALLLVLLQFSLLFSAFGQTKVTGLSINSVSGQYLPASNAIDGSSASQWSSGASPVSGAQFIEIDLGKARRLQKIRLLTSQSPSGLTTHTVSGRDASGAWVANYGTRTGATTDGQWLELSSTLSTMVRYVHIVTTTSPSWVGWREVEFYEFTEVAQPNKVLQFEELWATRPCISGLVHATTTITAGSFYSYSNPSDASACVVGSNKYYLTPYGVGSLYRECDENLLVTLNCTKKIQGGMQFRAANVFAGYTPTQQGFGLVSDKVFDKSKDIIIETAIKPVCSFITAGTWEGCFVGISLYNGENDYKGIMFFQSRDGLYVCTGYGYTLGENIECNPDRYFLSGAGELVAAVNPPGLIPLSKQ